MDFNHNGKDDIQEIKDGFAKFIGDVEAGNVTGVIQDVADAGQWVADELKGLAQDAQNFFNWALDRVHAESTSLGEAVANMLTLLANQNLQGALGVAQSSIAQLMALGSELVTAAVGLLTGFKAANA